MPKPVVSTEPSSHPLTRFTAQSRRDRRGELRRRSIPAASPRSQPTDTAPRHTDALRELVPDRVESLKKPPPAIAPLVGGPEPRRQACTLAEVPPPLCRQPGCRRPFLPRAAGSQQKFCSKSCRLAFHLEARQVGYRMVNAPGLRPGPASSVTPHAAREFLAFRRRRRHRTQGHNLDHEPQPVCWTPADRHRILTTPSGCADAGSRIMNSRSAPVPDRDANASSSAHHKVSGAFSSATLPSPEMPAERGALAVPTRLDDWIVPPDTADQRKRGRGSARRTETMAQRLGASMR